MYYYDPRLSIFISVDPLGEQTMEPYLYVGNNPINMVGPTGMAAEPPERDYENGYVHTDSDISWTYHNGSWFGNNGEDAYGYGEEIVLNMDRQGTINNAGEDSYFDLSKTISVVDNINSYYDGWDGSFATQAYKRAVITTALSAQLEGKKGVVNQMNGLSKSFRYSNAIKRAGPWVSGFVGLYNTRQGFKQQDGDRIGYHTQRAALGSGLSIVGGTYGATYGPSIGVWFGGVGAVPDATIGGFVGGIGGGMLGQTTGEVIIDKFHNR